MLTNFMLLLGIGVFLYIVAITTIDELKARKSTKTVRRPSGRDGAARTGPRPVTRRQLSR
jgi:hypothetical protein